MTTHRITYEGPSSLAIRTATRIAEADGVELTASLPPQRRDDAADTVVLTFTVEATREAAADAVRIVSGELPPTASVQLEPSSDAPAG